MPEWTREITHALTPLGLRPEREREIADELAAHLEDRYCDARGRGASDAEARQEALAELSGVLVPELRRLLVLRRDRQDAARRHDGRRAARRRQRQR